MLMESNTEVLKSIENLSQLFSGLQEEVEALKTTRPQSAVDLMNVEMDEHHH